MDLVGFEVGIVGGCLGLVKSLIPKFHPVVTLGHDVGHGSFVETLEVLLYCLVMEPVA